MTGSGELTLLQANIMVLLREQGRHASPAQTASEIAKDISGRWEKIRTATVSSALEKLRLMGLVQQVDNAEGPATWRAAVHSRLTR